MTGTVGLTFSIYKDEHGGAPLWLETQNVAVDAEGVYSVLLGNEKPTGVPREVFTSGEARWLGVRVESSEEAPRVFLATVPYALKSADAETLGGRPASSYMLVPSERSSTTANGSLAGELESPELGVSLTSETGTPNYLAKFLSSSTLGPSQVIETSAGLGIRVPTPEQTLDIMGRMQIRSQGLLGGGFWLRGTDGAPKAFMGMMGPLSMDRIGIYHNSMWRLIIDANGYVGIGVIPEHRFDMAGRMRIRASGSWTPGIWLGPATGDSKAFIGQTGLDAADPIGFFHTGSWRLAVGANGNVGVGTTAALERLDVNGRLRLRQEGTQAAGVWIGAASGPAPIFFGQTGIAATDAVGIHHGGAWRFVVDAGGNVGIGTTQPKAMLDVAGGLRLSAAGGITFPDNSVQTTAARSLTAADATIAVTTDANGTQMRVAPGGITAAHLAADSVETAAVKDGSITSPKVAAGAITTQHLAPLSVDGSKLADGSVTSGKLQPGTVENAIAENSLPGGKLTDGSVAGSKLAASSVGEMNLADGSVSGRKLLDGSVTATKIADGAITSAKMAPGAVGASALANGSVDSAKLMDAAVVSSKIADGAITAGKLAPGAVSSVTITDGSLSGSKLMDGSVPGTKLQNASVNSTLLADLSVTGQKLANNSVSTRNIQDGSISTTKLADGSVTAAKLSLGSIPPNAVSGTAAILGSNSFVGDQIVSGAIVANTLVVSGTAQLNAMNLGSTDGAVPAIAAHNDATTGNGYAVEAWTLSDTGRAIYARATSTTGSTVGVQGRADSTSGTAIQGMAYAASGNTVGVHAWNNSMAGTGVLAEAVSRTGTTTGIKSTTAGAAGSAAIWGIASNTATASATYGVRGESASTTGIGMLAYASSFSGSTKGLASKVESPQGVAGEFTNYANGEVLAGYNSSKKVFKVDGAGDVWAAGIFRSNGADYAESVAVVGDRTGYEPGDVLVVSEDVDRALVLSAEPYSSAVAGIFSTQPGVLGSAHSLNDPLPQDEVPLAVVGIVPCKASAENGPIRRGDLLVTSGIPGHVMRGSDRSRMLGAIVGKALQPLESGTGVIQVLVTLQ